MKKVRLREVMLFVQGHTALKQESGNLILGLLDLTFALYQTLGLPKLHSNWGLSGALGGAWGLCRLKPLTLSGPHPGFSARRAGPCPGCRPMSCTERGLWGPWASPILRDQPQLPCLSRTNRKPAELALAITSKSKYIFQML